MILNFKKYPKVLYLTSALLNKDKAGKVNSVNPLAGGRHMLTLRLKERHAHICPCRSVAMEGRIHSDLFPQDCCILWAVTIKLKLVRTRDLFCLVSSGENPNFKVVMKE